MEGVVLFVSVSQVTALEAKQPKHTVSSNISAQTDPAHAGFISVKVMRRATQLLERLHLYVLLLSATVKHQKSESSHSEMIFSNTNLTCFF